MNIKNVNRNLGSFTTPLGDFMISNTIDFLCGNSNATYMQVQETISMSMNLLKTISFQEFILTAFLETKPLDVIPFVSINNLVANKLSTNISIEYNKKSYIVMNLFFNCIGLKKGLPNNRLGYLIYAILNGVRFKIYLYFVSKSYSVIIY